MTKQFQQRVMWAVVVAFIALFMSGCATSKKSNFVSDYRDALQHVDAIKTVQHGSASEKAAIERFENFLSEMTAEKVRAQTKDVYAADAFLNDTLKTLHGADEIQAYFLATMDNAESVIVRFEDVAEVNGNYYFRWVMDVKFRKFKKGQTIRTIGVTHIRFNEEGKVVMHQDYWDSAAGLYEHVSVVGGMIRWIRGRL
jgi:hypothetical protein